VRDSAPELFSSSGFFGIHGVGGDPQDATSCQKSNKDASSAVETGRSNSPGTFKNRPSFVTLSFSERRSVPQKANDAV